MNELKLFNFEDCGVRVIQDESGEPWFVAVDITRVLGYSNGSKAVADHCSPKGITKRYTLTKGGSQELTYINEPNLYRLIIKSQKPEAERFERWVTEEVLPSIRKHGAYMTPSVIEQAILNPDMLIKLATTIKEEQERRRTLELELQEKTRIIYQQSPSVTFAKTVEASKTTILIRELAKFLRQNGINIGQNRLYEWMRENGYLIKSGSDYNTPTQKAMDMGLFEITERTIATSEKVVVSKTTKVTGKGQVYFINKFLTLPMVMKRHEIKALPSSRVQ